MDTEAARQIKKRWSRELMQRPDVVGVGLEEDAQGRPVLVVHVLADAAGGTQPGLPAEVDGMPVRIERSGPIRAQ